MNDNVVLDWYGVCFTKDLTNKANTSDFRTIVKEFWSSISARVNGGNMTVGKTIRMGAEFLPNNLVNIKMNVWSCDTQYGSEEYAFTEFISMVVPPISMALTLRYMPAAMQLIIRATR